MYWYCNLMKNSPRVVHLTFQLSIILYAIQQALKAIHDIVAQAISMQQCNLHFVVCVHSTNQEYTVAKDTAVAAHATVGRPKAAVGHQRAAHRLRLGAAAQPCPPICLKKLIIFQLTTG